MDFTVFYAWQSDTAPGFNRYLIRDALTAAIKALRIGALIEDAPRLDPDTRGPTIAPEITSSSFEKIRTSAVVVADITFVGATHAVQGRGPRKPLPNPNVALELGYAAATLGWDRVIPVINEAYGDAELQSFELRGRRPIIRYRMAEDTQTEVAEVRLHLQRSLDSALRLALSSEYERVGEIIASLDLNCLDLLKRYANDEIFWRRHDRKAAEFLMNAGVDSTFRHLLKLRLIRGNWEPSIGSYAYRWTYLGIQTLQRLGLRTETASDKRA